MSDPKHYIPKYTDEPERILFCTVNELALGAVLFMAFSWFGHEMIAIVAFAAVILIMRRLRNNLFKDGYSAFLYWHLPAITPQDKLLPKSSDREYLG